MEQEIEIESFSMKGWGIGYLSNSAKVEIPHALPGDKVLALVRSKRKRVRKARLLEVLTPSKNRVLPKCSHSKICGGCTWQEYSYPSQLLQKDTWIQELFSFALEEKVPIDPIVPCDTPWEYRNKMEFSFSQNAAGTKYLGLMIAGGGQYVFNVTECALASFWFSKVVQEVRAWWEESAIEAFQPRTESGHLLNLTVREGKNTNQKMVILTTLHDLPRKALDPLLEKMETLFLNKDFSFIWRKKRQQKNVPTSWEEETLIGKGYIFEKYFLFYKELWMKVSPTSFCQPNTHQAQKLYQKAFELLQLQGNEVLLDLYAGSASLAMVGSFFAKKVIAIEENPFSIQDARINLEKNQITNIHLLEGDVGSWLSKIEDKADAIIVDPPRAGLSPLAISNILSIKAPKLVYISCNPITQKEDVLKLCEKGYKMVSIHPFDQFPHTAHMENVVFLTYT